MVLYAAEHDSGLKELIREIVEDVLREQRDAEKERLSRLIHTKGDKVQSKSLIHGGRVYREVQDE